MNHDISPSLSLKAREMSCILPLPFGRHIILHFSARCVKTPRINSQWGEEKNQSSATDFFLNKNNLDFFKDDFLRSIGILYIYLEPK